MSEPFAKHRHYSLPREVTAKRGQRVGWDELCWDTTARH